MDTSQRRTITVGVFIGLSSILIFIVIFVLGQERSLFQSTTLLQIQFKEVAGLKPGAQVRLAGLGVGAVSAISFSPNLAEKKMIVSVHVRSDVMPRIRKDSVAVIGSKGLLGDKVIEITAGSPEQDQLKEGDFLPSDEAPDVFKILEKGQALISNGADVMAGLKEAIKKFTDDETVGNVKGIIRSLNDLFDEVEYGNGVLHGLVYDEKIQIDLKNTMANVKESSVRLKDTLDHIENITNQVREGGGMVHSLIYEKEGEEMVANLRRSSADLSDLLSAVKERKGMLHTMIYEEGEKNLISNLESASVDLKAILDTVEKGQGTIGGLVKDPTVYEDLKLILGNLKRNAVLKALIRMSLDKSDEDKARLGEERRVPPEATQTPVKGSP